MSTNTVRRIFISILIFLPLQYILVGIVGYYKAEPWPAFVFPGFKNVYDTEQTYQIYKTKFEIYNRSGEQVASLSPNLFFRGIPRSQIDGLERSVFRDKEQVKRLSPEARLFLFENGKRLTESEISTLKIIYRKDVLKTGKEDLEIDLVEADTIGIIEVAAK